MLRHVVPGSNIRNAPHQRLDVTVNPIDASELLVDPIGVKAVSRPGQLQVNFAQQADVQLEEQLRIVRYLAHFPEQSNELGRVCTGTDFWFGGQCEQCLVVLRWFYWAQLAPTWTLPQGFNQRLDAVIIERAIAPEELGLGWELVTLERTNYRFGEGLPRRQDTEGSIVDVASSATGDLGQLRQL